MTFPIHIEVRFSANPLDKTLFSVSNTLSYGNLRFLHGLDFDRSGYRVAHYQAFAREGRPAEKVTAELRYAVAAVVELLEEDPTRASDVVRQLRRAVESSQAWEFIRFGSHIEDEARDFRSAHPDWNGVAP